MEQTEGAVPTNARPAPAARRAPADDRPAVQPDVRLEDLENLSWSRLFGNDNPVEVEIGIGKGGFLLRRAQRLADRNFFGIEWANKYYRFAVDRMRRHGVANVRIVRTDADHFIRVLCPLDSISILHVYHPDPWPKKRHHKRRLFQPRFVDAVVRCLAPGGLLRVQTDHAEYFQIIRDLLLGHPQLSEVDFFDGRFDDDTERIETNFEVKYAREGREIYRVAVRRIAHVP